MYCFSSRVRYSETDEYGKLTLTGIMNYLQDCSTFQSEDNGSTFSYLSSRHKAWFLSSWQIMIDRYPVLGEEIVISTWPYDFKGFYGYRNYTIRDQSGNYLVRANSIWFLFDTKKGRPVKIEPDDIKGYGSVWEERLNMDYAQRKLVLPENLQKQKPVTIGRHHIDTNHHVNNAKYMEIAREVLPNNLEVTELRVEYKKALFFGDVIYPCVAGSEEEYTVSVHHEDGSISAIIWLQGTTERK